MEDSSMPSAAAVDAEGKKDPDFLFGLEKGHHPHANKLDDGMAVVAPTVMVAKGFSAGPEDRHVIGEPVMPPPPPPEIQRQIHDFQRMHISNHEQGAYNRKFEDYYHQEKAPAPPQQQMHQPQQGVPMATNPAAYWKETQEPYPAGTNEQSVYFIQTPSGVYQALAPPAMRPVTGQVGQAYHGVQRMVPDMYREQQMFNAVVPQVSSTLMQQQQQQKMGGPYTSEGIGGLVRSQVPETGYGQMGYVDGAGRPVYYAAAGGHGPGGLIQQQQPPPYTAVAGGMDIRQTGGAINQEGKIINKTPQPY